MIFHTETGSTYEIDPERRRARRLHGRGPSTPRTGPDGDWKSFAWATAVEVGAPVLVAWTWDERKRTGKATRTSIVTRVAEGFDA